MIDRKSRDMLSETLRQYISGRVTNDTLYNLEIKSEDRGIWAIRHAAWFLYDDLYEHKAVGKHAIKGKYRDEVSKWIVFLQSDQEYLWPSMFQRFLSVLTLKFFKINKSDKEVWPFFTKKDFNKALKNPKLLNKKVQT